ncbi:MULTISPECIES: hypothetical protein [Mammaliicoccus]|uniref:hypothetical protein n=1 Tax=Mammaliicoccus TaxID=2803850 RepID=UPI00065BBE2A|nr:MULTISPECIES: hypothetical protein [Mammaliicoccus]AQN32264.1 hypothetical protein [Staphylococcus phage phi879]MCD5140441.1 hypothetical protein [Mammaliicoccus sciuri]PNY96179.1 hypothetical protein CD035_04200 [Mammaliicoccus sciuri]SQE50893.1 Bacteriophage [Mammaliicoccus sciuri]
MTEFKVKHIYKDIEIGKVFRPGDVVKMTVKRANEINEKLKKHGVILERAEKVEEKVDVKSEDKK